MQSSIAAQKHGIMQLVVDQDPIKIMVISSGGDPLQFGDKVSIIAKSTTENVYVVKHIQ